MMNILFLHFPVDNNQIEGKYLPDFFATMGHKVFSVFEKRQRNFYSKHKGTKLPVVELLKEEIRKIKFDLIVCKNDAFQKYGKDFRSDSTKIINVMPMGINNNYNNCDFYFKENELIKAPIEEMQNVFDKEYKNWKDRKKQIIVPASIGSDKNQKEIVDLIDANLFSEYSILFAGKIYNQNYANYLKLKLDQKSVNSIFKFLTREELAREFLNSKLTMLTTDPRPIQPFDPGPRVIFESIRAGTPCLINDLVLVNSYCKPYCLTYKNGNKESFEKTCKLYLNRENNLLSLESYKVGKKYLNMNFACKNAYEKIIGWMN